MQRRLQGEKAARVTPGPKHTNRGMMGTEMNGPPSWRSGGGLTGAAAAAGGEEGTKRWFPAIQHSSNYKTTQRRGHSRGPAGGRHHEED